MKSARLQSFGGNLDPVTVERACRYEGGRSYAVQPSGLGKGRGGKSVGRIRIKDVRRQSLGFGSGGLAEVRREGFRSWNGFAEYWIQLYGSFDSTQLVDRIEFELLEDAA